MVVERPRRWRGRGSGVATSFGTACRRRLSKPAACEQQRVPGGPEVQRASMEAVALQLGDPLTAEAQLFENYYPGICRDLDIPAEAPASRAAAIAAVRALSRKKGIIGSTSRWMSSEDTGRQTCRSRHARRFLLDAGRPAPRARPWQRSMPVRSLVRSPGAALPRASSPWGGGGERNSLRRAGGVQSLPSVPRETSHDLSTSCRRVPVLHCVLGLAGTRGGP